MSTPAQRHTLPLAPSPLIGRGTLLAELCDRLRDGETRLLTLTGAPGTGKTRLALAVAAAVTERFGDGVYFAPLDDLRDPEHVIGALARALALREAGGRPLLSTLIEAIGDRELLLLVDNFEHLMAAAPALTELLAACPRLTLLTTSRAPLDLRWEAEIPVPPLPSPPAPQESESGGERHRGPTEALDAPDRLIEYGAVELFVTRARAVRPEFRLIPENAAVVAEICRRLDGLPLALELAAARVRLLSPAAILSRLEHRLDLLTHAARDLPPRHQTLRAAIAWSYDLLTPAEQALFRRMGVFTGGCTLEAAAVVTSESSAAEPHGNPELGVIELLSVLTSHSLLVRDEQPDGEPRLRMLETLREYARERLAEAGELEEAQARHAAFVLSLAEISAARLGGPEQQQWLDRLEVELGNLRAALDWAITSGHASLAVQLAGALFRFWLVRGHLSEGRRWLERTLAIGGRAPASARAAALYAAAALARQQKDHAAARPRLEECLALRRDLGDEAGTAAVLADLAGMARDEGDYAAMAALYDEALTLQRHLHDHAGMAATLNGLGIAVRNQGDLHRAQALVSESLALYRELEDQRNVAVALNTLATIARQLGDLAEARTRYEESLALLRQVGDRRLVAASLVNLGHLCIRQGDLDAAQARYGESLSLAEALSDRASIANAHGSLGDVARERGEYARADALYQQTLAYWRQTDDRRMTAAAIANVAETACLQGRLADARALFGECLALHITFGIRPSIAHDLEGLAAVATALGHAEPAVRLLAGAEVVRDGAPATRYPAQQVHHELIVASLRAVLGETTFDGAWAIGMHTPLEQIYEEAIALAQVEPPHSATASHPALPDGLTPREVEVLSLIAAGRSNAEVAAALTLSVRTVEKHIAHVYGKIGARGRADATAYAYTHGLTGAPVS